MNKSFVLDNLKYIVNNMKRHIKEIIAYVVVFFIVCVTSIDFLPQTKAVNGNYSYSAAYSINPIFPKTSNFTFYNIKKPKGDDVNEMEDYANYQAFVGYAMIWNLTYKDILKNFEDSTTLKSNLYKIAEDIANNYDIDDKETLMVYKFTCSKFSGLNNTYGFILAESSEYNGSAIFVGCSDKVENDRRFYFMEDSGSTGHSFIDKSSDEFKNTRNYAQNFTKSILKVTRKEGLIYNEKSQKLLSYIPSNARPSFKLNGIDIDDIPYATDAGEYRILYSIAETSDIAKSSGNLTVTISKADQQVEPPKTLSEWESGSENLIVEPPKIIFGNKNAVIKYSMDNKSWSNLSPTTDFLNYFSQDSDGQWTIYYKIEGNNNFNEKTGYVKTDFSRKEQKVEAPKINLGLVYNGEYQNLIENEPKVLEGQGNETKPIPVSYSVNKKLNEIDGEWDKLIPMARDAGDYYVYYKIDGNGEYNPYINYVIVSVAKNNQELKAPEGNELTYNGEYQDLLAKYAEVTKGNKDEGKKVLYRTNNYEYWHEKPIGLNAGKYTVYYRSEANNNYNEFLGSIEVEIKKADQTIEVPSGVEDITYDGESKKLLSSELKIVNGNEYGIRYRINGGEWSSNIPYATNAGEYTIDYKVLGSDNYNEYPSKSITSRIIKSNQNVDPPTPRDDEITYTGYAQNLIKDVPKIVKGNSSGLIEYDVVSEQENENWNPEDASWNQSLPTAINAGSYVIHYRIKGDNNYEDFIDSVSVSIKKAKQEVNPPQIVNNLIDDGQEQILLSSPPVVEKGNKDGNIEYSLDDNSSESAWKTDIPSSSVAGKHTIYYRVPGNDNYEEFNGSIELNIKYQQEITPPGVPDGLSYNAKSQKLLSSGALIQNGNSDAKVEYSLDGTNWSQDIPSEVNPGTYTVRYRVDGNNEYAPFEDSIEVEMSDPRTSWGKPVDISGITHYIDDKGKTSVEVTDDDIIWLKEESYMTYAWYGLDNSSKVFEKGSRFWVRWINKDTDEEEWNYYYERIDDENKIIADGEKLWIFLVGVTAPNGDEYKYNFKAKVPLLVQLGSDWDEGDLKAIFIADKTDDDTPVDIASISYVNYPEGNAKFAKLILEHFSPYGIIDKNENINEEGGYKENSKSVDDESKGNSVNNSDENPVDNNDENVKTLEYKTYDKNPSVNDVDTKDDSVMCLSYCVSILSFLAMYKPKFW